MPQIDCDIAITLINGYWSTTNGTIAKEGKACPDSLVVERGVAVASDAAEAEFYVYFDAPGALPTPELLAATGFPAGNAVASGFDILGIGPAAGPAPSGGGLPAAASGASHQCSPAAPLLWAGGAAMCAALLLPFQF